MKNSSVIPAKAGIYTDNLYGSRIPPEAGRQVRDDKKKIMKKHLAIFKGEVGELILSGKKTIESRFSRAKLSPFGVISRGDLVYIKPSGKDIIGEFRVKKVIFFDGLDADDFVDLRKRYESKLSVEEDYWARVAKARFGTLVFIGDSSRYITSPVKIKKSDLRGWVVL